MDLGGRLLQGGVVGGTRRSVDDIGTDDAVLEDAEVVDVDDALDDDLPVERLERGRALLQLDLAGELLVEDEGIVVAEEREAARRDWR